MSPSTWCPPSSARASRTASPRRGSGVLHAPHSQRGRRWQEYLDGRQVAAVDGPPAPSRPSGERRPGRRHRHVGGERVAEPDRPLRADDATAQFHLSQSAILRTLRDEARRDVLVGREVGSGCASRCDSSSTVLRSPRRPSAVGSSTARTSPRACNEMLGLPPQTPRRRTRPGRPEARARIRTKPAHRRATTMTRC